jgi:acyl-CoA thioester hydrolase
MNDATALHHKVCYADTDAGGVVYHARYIEMVERSRNRVMYAAGYSFAELAQAHQVMLIVHKVQATYLAPAFLEDDLSLSSRLSACRPSRTVWETEVRRGETLLATVSMDMVALDTVTRRLARMPEAFLAALRPFAKEVRDGATVP